MFANILTLGVASVVDYAIQLLLPIAMVRLLDGDAYAQYRMLFLMVNTAMALAPLYMPQALFYFLPKAESNAEKAFYIGNTVVFLFITGCITGLLINPWLPIIPEKFFGITRVQILIPLFILVWVLSSLLDSLPNANNRIRCQAGIMLSMSILRVSCIVTTAWLTGNVEWVFFILCVFIAIKTMALLIFIRYEIKPCVMQYDADVFKIQLKYSIPFGISAALYMLKIQADQWIAAYLFVPFEYAVFSFGIYVAPLMNILRNAINNAALPTMSKAYAVGEYSEVIAQFKKVNFIMACFILPLLAVLYVTAEHIIRFLFTETYIEAAGVMRIYIVGFVVQCLESTAILRLCNAGKFSLKLNASLLPIAVLLDFAGARFAGIQGAALGSVITLYIGELINLKKSATAMGISFYQIIDWSSWLALLLAAMITGWAGLWLDNYLIMDSLMKGIVVGTSMLLIYSTLFAVTYGIYFLNKKTISR